MCRTAWLQTARQARRAGGCRNGVNLLLPLVALFFSKLILGLLPMGFLAAFLLAFTHPYLICPRPDELFSILIHLHPPNRLTVPPAMTALAMRHLWLHH